MKIAAFTLSVSFLVFQKTQFFVKRKRGFFVDVRRW